MELPADGWQTNEDAVMMQGRKLALGMSSRTNYSTWPWYPSPCGTSP